MKKLLAVQWLVLAGAAAAVVGGVAYAAIPDSHGVFHGCYKRTGGEQNGNNNGSNNGSGEIGALRVVDSASQCKSNEFAISWNERGPKGDAGPQGPPGAAGTSIVNKQLAVGDANCPSGGTAFTGAGGTTYACNGAPGPAGPAGKDGKNGIDGHDGVSVTSRPLAVDDPNCPAGGTAFTSASGLSYACNGAKGAQGPPGTFTGVFTSANGQYSLRVEDTGLVFSGPTGSFRLNAAGVQVLSSSDLTLKAGANASLEGGVATTISGASSLMLRADGNATLHSGGVTTVDAPTGSVKLNATGAEILSSLDLMLKAGSNAAISAGANAAINAGANATLQGNGLTTVSGGAGSFKVTGTGVEILSSLGLLMQAGVNATLQAGANASIKAGASALLEGSGMTSVKGGTLLLNSGGLPVARLSDQVLVNVPFGGCTCVGQIVSGSTTVNAG